MPADLYARLAVITMKCKAKIEHYGRAWRYAMNKMTAEDAQIIFVDCEHAAGWHTLQILSVEDTIEQALERYKDTPELREYIEEGVQYVARKYEQNGNVDFDTKAWAIERALEYAAEDGWVVEEKPKD